MESNDLAPISSLLLEWSDTYWFSALRIVMITVGGLAGLLILFGYWLRSWPKILTQIIAVTSWFLGPFAGTILAQIYGLSDCQALSLSVGRKLFAITCDLYAEVEDSIYIWTEEEIATLESNPLYAMQDHWLFISVSWVFSLLIAFVLILELYDWIKAKLDKSKEI